MSQDCLLFFDMVLFGVFFFWLRLTRYALRCKYDSNKAPMTTTDDTDTCRRPARGPLVRRRRRHLVQTGRPGEATDRRPDATTDQSERPISQGITMCGPQHMDSFREIRFARPLAQWRVISSVSHIYRTASLAPFLVPPKQFKKS